MPRFYSLLEKIFVVLLLLRGHVSVLLAAREIFVVLEIFMVLATDSRVPLSLLDPHGLAFFGPCLLLRDLTAACSSWVEIRVRVLQQTSY